MSTGAALGFDRTVATLPGTDQIGLESCALGNDANGMFAGEVGVGAHESLDPRGS